MNQKEYLIGFEKLTDKMLEITKQKNNDYSGEDNDNPFANFEAVETFGISTTDGFITRIIDKIKRISNLTRQENSVKDESIEDTLLDLASYSLLMLLYIKSRKGK